MHKVLVLFLTVSLCTYAAMPKLYSAIGDPLYQEIPAVEKMSKIKYFKKYRTQLDSFIREASDHKKLGLLYDLKRKKKTLSKDERQMYRNTLRDLEKRLFSISAIARKGLSDMIANNQAKNFKLLMQTQFMVFKEDPKSVTEIRAYSKKLRHQQYIRQKRKEKQAEDQQETYKKMLRSAKNLNGTWKGKSSDGSTVTAYFEQERLSFHYTRAEHINIYKGTYTVDKALDFHIFKRALLKAGVSHIRRIDLQRRYELLSISKKELHLRYKAESIILKR